MIKLKILLLTAPMLALSVSLFARPLTDSVGVENVNGKKVILHKLDPKDNYYSLGRRYNVKPALIIQYNNNAKLTIGNLVKVPTDMPYEQTAAAPVHAAVKPQQQQIQQPVNQQPAVNTFQYKVSQGETLYSIAKRFATTVDDLTKLNNLPSTTLAPGQILQIRASGSPQPQAAQSQQNQPANNTVANTPQTTATNPVVRNDSPKTAIIDSSNLGGHRANGKSYGLYEKDEKGVATWIDDAGMDPNKKLVLHRTAPIGTVIRITNPMTNRTTFAKVVGRFADSEATKDVIIVMTKNTAESLGALDKRFHVNISYGTPNE